MTTMSTTPTAAPACAAGGRARACMLAPRTAAAQGTFQDRGSHDRRTFSSAIKAGQTTCQEVVQAYIERAKAYNGTCTALVTADGSAVAPATGAVRAGAPLTFPDQTVRGLELFPDFNEYAGLPLELGRMEPTISDPSVQQQFGMRVGIPNAGQLNALETLNIRGERSVTCKGDFDRASVGRPAAGGRAGGLRRVPQAARRARARRGTGHAVRHESRPGEAADVLRRVLAQELVRREGHASAPAATTSTSRWTRRRSIRRTSPSCARRARSSTPLPPPTTSADASSRTGPAKAEDVHARRQPAGTRSWGGQACNPYDTARVPRGTSNGSGVSVAANLVDLLDLRTGLRILQGPGVAQQRRQPPDHQGHHDGRRHHQQEAWRSRRAFTAGPSTTPRWCSMPSRATSRTTCSRRFRRR